MTPHEVTQVRVPGDGRLWTIVDRLDAKLVLIPEGGGGAIMVPATRVRYASQERFFATIDGIRYYVTQVLTEEGVDPSVVEVMDYRRRPRPGEAAGVVTIAGGLALTVSRDLYESELLHEIAHVIQKVRTGAHDDHGPIWQGIYQDLLDRRLPGQHVPSRYLGRWRSPVSRRVA